MIAADARIRAVHGHRLRMLGRPALFGEPILHPLLEHVEIEEVRRYERLDHRRHQHPQLVQAPLRRQDLLAHLAIRQILSALELLDLGPQLRQLLAEIRIVHTHASNISEARAYGTGALYIRGWCRSRSPKGNGARSPTWWRSRSAPTSGCRS